jgi:hypothetical protein
MYNHLGLSGDARSKLVKASNTAHKVDDDAILNVPGWRERSESTLAHPSVTAPAISETSVDDTLRPLLVTRNKELEFELRGLRFVLWRMRLGPRSGWGTS